jgi:general transcription factor 3C polypeptide 5 (transcription factor C subunit 1)
MDNEARAIQNFQFEPELEDYTIYEPSTSSLAGPSTNIAVDTNQESEGRNREEKALVARSNLRMFPPPLFSRQGIQQNYKYGSRVKFIVFFVTVD